MSTACQLWPEVEVIIRKHQPEGRLPMANVKGWIGPIHSPLREEEHPSFSVLPDSPSQYGAFIDHATGEHGTMAELARRLGVSVDVKKKSVESKTGRSASERRDRLTHFCRERNLDPEFLEKKWKIKVVTHRRRPAIRYPTPAGGDRIKFLDGRKPKYLWASQGGRAHWYGLCSAVDFGKDLYLVNGEPSVWAAQQAGVAAVCICAGEGTIPSPKLIAELKSAGVRRIKVVYDRDEEGRNGSLKVVRKLNEAGVDATAIELPEEVGVGGDVDDLHRLHGSHLTEVLAQLPELTEQSCRESKPDNPLLNLDQLTERSTHQEIVDILRCFATDLASVDELHREVAREAAVRHLKSLKFVSPARLVDAAFNKIHKKKDDSGSVGTEVILVDPELWPDPLAGEDLLNELESVIQSYVALPKKAAATVALWVFHVHAHEVSRISPLLAIVSPEKRCGKTTLLVLISRLCPRSLFTSNITPPALFRAVERFRPTLLVDEADTFLRHNDELRGILNSGHIRESAFVVRTAGDDFEPRTFSTWAPKAIALIGNLPSTLEDRSIAIAMRRRAPGEEIKRLRGDRLCELDHYCKKVARWVRDHSEELRLADPEVPEGLHDRAADNWRPLFSIADAAGGDWPQKARQAALDLSGVIDTDSESSGVLLLHDIRTIFCRFGADRLPSERIVRLLSEMEERPWPEWKGGKSITPRQVARLLRPYGIRPSVLRIGEDTPRGYERSQFRDAFARYLGDDPQQPQQTRNHDAFGEDTSATLQEDVAETEQRNLFDFNAVADVADEAEGMQRLVI